MITAATASYPIFYGLMIGRELRRTTRFEYLPRLKFLVVPDVRVSLSSIMNRHPHCPWLNASRHVDFLDQQAHGVSILTILTTLRLISMFTSSVPCLEACVYSHRSPRLGVWQQRAPVIPHSVIEDLGLHGHTHCLSLVSCRTSSLS